MSVFEAKDGGTLIRVYAAPRASKEAVIGEFDGMLKVAVKAPPVDGAANKAFEKYLGKKLGSPVTLVSGASGRRKVFWVEMDPEDVAARLS